MTRIHGHVLQFLSAIIVIAVFILDRLTKLWIQRNMVLGESRGILSFFHITYIENTGAAFGLGQNQNRFFIFSSIVILGALFFLRRQWEKADPQNAPLRVGLALVISGALGNLYDRIVHGSVIDFLDFFIGRYHWPAFNVADSAICAAAFLLIFSHWKKRE